MAFHVGQKVVCINDALEVVAPMKTSDPIHMNLEGLRQGEVYTVSHYCSDFEDYWYAPVPVVWLREIHRRNDQPFAACRFRAFVERKTDISVFTSMLTPKKARERA